MYEAWERKISQLSVFSHKATILLTSGILSISDYQTSTCPRENIICILWGLYIYVCVFNFILLCWYRYCYWGYRVLIFYLTQRIFHANFCFIPSNYISLKNKIPFVSGLDALAYDPHKFAMDYHNIGFRECATEVARYLVTIEGMDIQDPLRLRLMSHLQCFAAQRELATKQAAVSPWGYGSSSQNYTPPINPIPSSPSAPVSGNLIGNLPPHPSHQGPPAPPSLLHHNIHDLNSHFDISTSCAQATVVPTSSDARQTQPSSTSILTPLTTATTTTASAFGYHHQYPNLNSFSASAPNNGHHPNYNQGNSSSQMKPYRPWGGAEVAY